MFSHWWLSKREIALKWTKNIGYDEKIDKSYYTKKNFIGI